jgi:hypothetical protein
LTGDIAAKSKNLRGGFTGERMPESLRAHLSRPCPYLCPLPSEHVYQSVGAIAQEENFPRNDDRVQKPEPDILRVTYGKG